MPLIAPARSYRLLPLCFPLGRAASGQLIPKFAYFQCHFACLILNTFKRMFPLWYQCKLMNYKSTEFSNNIGHGSHALGQSGKPGNVREISGKLRKMMYSYVKEMIRFIKWKLEDSVIMEPVVKQFLFFPHSLENVSGKKDMYRRNLIVSFY